MMGAEFVCETCGAYVFSAAMTAPPDPPVCLRCAFLDATIPDPEERAAVRAFLDRDGEGC